jgi:microcompartment protein CcmK/EutM
MRLGTVIGRVTLSQAVPALTGGRFLVVSPFTREHFQQGTETPPGMSKDPSVVVYDNLGGGVGQTIGFIEGAEATAPGPEALRDFIKSETVKWRGIIKKAGIEPM